MHLHPITSMQNQILWNLFTQGIDKILIHLMSCPQRAFWSITIIQLISLMYKDQHVGALQKSFNQWIEGVSYSEISGDDKESKTSGDSRREFTSGSSENGNSKVTTISQKSTMSSISTEFWNKNFTMEVSVELDSEKIVHHILSPYPPTFHKISTEKNLFCSNCYKISDPTPP